MRDDGNNGTNGLDTSRSCRYATMHESRKGGRNVMARSMGVRPASPVRRHAKAIGVLLLVFVVAIVVSAMALVPLGKEKAANSEMPADTRGRPPGTPYLIAGYTYDAFGVKLPSCDVVVTDVTRSLSSPLLTSSPTSSYYSTQLQVWCPDWQVGDQIKIVATKGINYGENLTVVGGGAGLILNVTLNLVIPEFPVAVVPIVGMIGLFVAVSVRSRRD